MYYNKKDDNPNPTLSANIASRIWFTWLLPLFWHGRNHEIEEKHLFNTLPKDRSGPLGDKLEKLWDEELKKAKKEERKPKFLNTVNKVFFWSSFRASLLLAVAQVILKPLLPMLMASYIEYFEIGSTMSKNECYLYSTSVIVCMYLITILCQHTTIQLQLVGMQARIACSSLIYRKITRLSNSSVSQISEGFVTNLLLDDVSRVEQWFICLHQGWMTVLQAPIIIYLVWKRVGVACIMGIVLLFLETLPVQVFFGKIIFKLRRKVSTRTDKRILLIQEIINGIRVIKMYTWEKPIEKLVFFARKYEIDAMTNIAYCKSMNLAAWSLIERTTLFITILSYVFFEGQLTSVSDTYLVLQHFNSLQIMIGFYVTRLVSCVSETKVAVKRIEKFLLLKEVNQIVKPLLNNEDDVSISIQHVTASWTIDSKPVLININIQLHKEKLYFLLGSAGSGKRSFFKLILEELQPSEGEILLQGKVSYSSQEPWLFADSIRNNILFGEPYDEIRYANVTKACCLLTDFAQLPYGDKTMLTEGGSILSGGQRARINLARAVYRNAEIYLLDDPLSAVDSNVGKQLLENCFNGFLKSKTRILVTHNLQYLNKSDNVILFDKGSVRYQGTFGSLQNDDKQFQNLSTFATLEDSLQKDMTKNNGQINIQNEISNLDDEKNDCNEDADESAELMAKGKMNKSLLWKYFKSSGSPWTLIVVLLSFVFTQFVFSSTDYWVAYIVGRNENHQNYSFHHVDSNIMLANTNIESRNVYLYIYGSLIAACVILTITKNLLYFKTCMNANNNIHNSMLIALLRTPLRFFHLNTAGCIINRFSKDVGVVDEYFPTLAYITVHLIFIVTGVAVQIFIINWWIVFPTIIILYLYWLIDKLYSPTARNIRRLEGTSKSPVLSHISSSFSGLLTIRSCQAESMMCKEFDYRQDNNTSASYLVSVSLTAFGVWIDLLTISMVAIVIYSFVVIDDGEFASNVGLAVTQIYIIMSSIQFIMKQIAEMKQQLVNVERMFQFTKLDREDLIVSEPNKKPPHSWPSSGSIEFDHLYLKYTKTAEPVLKNLNFSIQPGEKVGIVGRTGAGKTSLVAALFRLAKTEGSLYVDHVNINEISLHEIRAKISIIPQESFFISTSLRENVDPNHEFDDATIWTALNDVGLNMMFASLDESLEQKHLSIGQLQLLSLVRVIMRNNKILVLDEATANVDQKTDALIQKIVKNKFNKCTVLTIAHRLNTIIDSDKVLVMDAGEVVEYDHPHILLQKSDGYFLKMVQQSGGTVYESFMERIHNDKIVNK